MCQLDCRPNLLLQLGLQHLANLKKSPGITHSLPGGAKVRGIVNLFNFRVNLGLTVLNLV
jgi:hypothetical protein